jgi:mannosyl-3-phosphoglycerate phosphatase
MKRWIVFTDLDGTLLDRDYSWQKAAPAVRALREAGIPLVLNSSKTVAEMRVIRAELGLDSVCIAENGGVIEGIDEVETAGCSVRDELVALARELRNERGFRFEGFVEWDVERLMELTNLSREQALCSMEREATEPIVWLDTADRLLLFERLLSEQGVKLVRGGQFRHLMRADRDKGWAMEKVLSWYRKRDEGVSWGSVALGDSPNDWPMLERADVAVQMPGMESMNDWLCWEHVRRGRMPGAAGWNVAILDFLNELREEVQE